MISFLLIAGMANAAEEIPWPPDQSMQGRSDCVFKWEYPDGVEMLAYFAIYVRAEGADYVPHKPTKIVVAIPEMATRFDCQTLILWAPGKYYAIVRAVSVLNEESDPSNEMSFWWEPPQATIPPSPPRLPPPVVQLPPAWDQPKPPSKPLIMPPAPPSSGGWLTQTCAWTGNCGR